MPSLRKLQRAFSREVFDAESAAARGFVVEDAFTGAEHLAVYRNNLYITLREALAAIYPVVAQLVGEAFFAAAARVYTLQHPSRSGNVQTFGDRFPEFLAGFPPAAGLPYLPDMARLEWAWHRAFHAADCPPFPLQRLAQIPPERYGELRFTLHPSVTLLRSPYPVGQLWAAHQEGGPDLSSVRLDAGGECLLVQRCGLEVEVVPLEGPEATFLDALMASAPLEQAAAAAPDFDLNAGLQRHLQRTTLVNLRLPEPSQESFA